MRRKIAVLGGGAGALSAVFELTRREGWRDRYDITVYQMGHRLGGKGASGVNRAEHDRIEEHGLHVFWGFYENSFRMLREVYAELGRPDGAPMARFEEAFSPHDLIVLPERGPDGAFGYWPIRFPRNPRSPGDGLDDMLEPWDYVPRLCARLLDVMGVGREDTGDRGWLAWLGPLIDRAISHGAGAVEALDRALGGLTRSLFASLVHTSRLAKELVGGLAVARAVAEQEGRSREERASSVLFLVRHARACFARLIDSGETDERLRVQLDMGLALLRGLLVDGLVIPPRDFHSLDDESLVGWLARQGVREETLQSPLLHGLHAALYSNNLDIAAGTAVHGLLRMMFTYKGAVLWKMQAGMGETVFAPLYEVLARRGVRFEFFHAVDHLELSEDRGRVARVVIDRQATPRGGRYRPLIDVRGLPVWPSEPLLEQLEEGEELQASGVDLEDWWSGRPPVERLVLEDGRDFDLVILGIALGALRDVCAELCADETNPRFGAMVEHVRTTLTQSAQLWMSVGIDRMGWDASEPPIVIPYTPPMDTWADMAHLLVRESWPEGARPGSCAYLTARLDDDEPVPPRGRSDYPSRLRERIRANTASWLRDSAGGLWRGATSTHDRNELLWHWLWDDRDREGEARLDAQWIAPVPNPSNRYVLTVPGTTRFRLRPRDSGYENLALAGDWTRNAINGGCFESAAMSGADAARVFDPGVRPSIGDWLSRLEEVRPRTLPPPAEARPGTLPPPPDLGPRRPVSVIPAPLRELPRYVARDGELLAVPPIQLDVDVTMFALRADTARLRSLLDAHLNLRRDAAVYRPLAPLAVLYFARVDNFPVIDPMGHVPELDFGLWVPALGGTEVGGRFVADRVVTFTPYLWVSNDIALSNGRSIFGFYKDLGTRMAMPDEAEPDAPYALDTWVIPRFGADATLESRPLIGVRSTSKKGRLRTAAEAGNLMALMARALVDRVGDESGSALRSGLLLAKAAPRGQRMVFLKQFPDAEDARRACYQAVVESDIRFTSEPLAEAMDDGFEVTLHEYDSHHVASTLGLVADRIDGRSRVVTPIACGRARFSAVVENPSVIWERGPRGR